MAFDFVKKLTAAELMLRAIDRAGRIFAPLFASTLFIVRHNSQKPPAVSGGQTMLKTTIPLNMNREAPDNASSRVSKGLLPRAVLTSEIAIFMNHAFRVLFPGMTFNCGVSRCAAQALAQFG